jgi:hypothetical protein
LSFHCRPLITGDPHGADHVPSDVDSVFPQSLFPETDGAPVLVGKPGMHDGGGALPVVVVLSVVVTVLVSVVVASVVVVVDGSVDVVVEPDEVVLPFPPPPAPSSLAPASGARNNAANAKPIDMRRRARR